jgi:hypothetical protein
MLVKATTFSFIVFFPTYLYNIGNGMTFFFFASAAANYLTSQAEESDAPRVKSVPLSVGLLV